METTYVTCTVVVSISAKSLTTVVTSVTFVVAVFTLAYAILAANVTLVVHIAYNVGALGKSSAADIAKVILASVCTLGNSCATLVTLVVVVKVSAKAGVTVVTVVICISAVSAIAAELSGSADVALVILVVINTLGGSAANLTLVIGNITVEAERIATYIAVMVCIVTIFTKLSGAYVTYVIVACINTLVNSLSYDVVDKRDLSVSVEALLEGKRSNLGSIEFVCDFFLTKEGSLTAAKGVIYSRCFCSSVNLDGKGVPCIAVEVNSTCAVLGRSRGGCVKKCLKDKSALYRSSIVFSTGELIFTGDGKKSCDTEFVAFAIGKINHSTDSGCTVEIIKIVIEAYNELVALSSGINSSCDGGVAHAACIVGVNSPKKNGVSCIGRIYGYVHLSVSSVGKHVSCRALSNLDELLGKLAVCPSGSETGVVGSSCVSTGRHLESEVAIGYAACVVSNEYRKNGICTSNLGLKLLTCLEVLEDLALAVVYSPEVKNVSATGVNGSEVCSCVCCINGNHFICGVLCKAHRSGHVNGDISKLCVTSVTYVVTVSVCAEVLLTNVTVVVCVGCYVGTIGNPLSTFFTEVVVVIVGVHSLATIVTYAVVVSVVAKRLATLVAVAVVGVVEAHALATHIALVVSVAAVLTLCENLLTSIALVVVVAVVALRKNCAAVVTLVVVSEIISALAENLATNVTLVVSRIFINLALGKLAAANITVVILVIISALGHYRAAKVALMVLVFVGALGSYLAAGIALVVIVAVCMSACIGCISRLVNVAA